MAMRLPAEDPDEGKREMRAARSETLEIFFEPEHGPNWTERLKAAIAVENAIAEKYGL